MNISNKGCSKQFIKNVNFDGIQTQIDWLDSTLTEMSQDEDIIWKIIVIHHPFFSYGQTHGDNAGLSQTVLPIVEKHRVDTVIAGHDHNVQYMRTGLDIEKSSSDTAKCSTNPKKIQCDLKEFFHEQLDECGNMNAANRPHSFRWPKVEYGRESISMKSEYLNHFVLGNGGIHSKPLCRIRAHNSEAELIYGNTVTGVGDIKITEKKIEVKMISLENEVLYTTKIIRNMHQTFENNTLIDF